MRTIAITTKYKVGDKVWIMRQNYPTCMEITRVAFWGWDETKDGFSAEFGKVKYYLGKDQIHGFDEIELCESFDELRDIIFCNNTRERAMRIVTGDKED